MDEIDKEARMYWEACGEDYTKTMVQLGGLSEKSLIVYQRLQALGLKIIKWVNIIEEQLKKDIPVKAVHATFQNVLERNIAEVLNIIKLLSDYSTGEGENQRTSEANIATLESWVDTREEWLQNEINDANQLSNNLSKLTHQVVWDTKNCLKAETKPVQS
eukprot:UN28560